MKPSALIAWRERRGWNQSQLAEALGVSRRTVNRWENSPNFRDLPRYLELALTALESIPVVLEKLENSQNG